MTLYRDGQVFSPADPRATALAVRDGEVVWLGEAADAPAADRVVELDGALVTPAFVDAHVHLGDTGLTLAGLDVSRATSPGLLLEAVAGHCAGLAADAVVLGHGWDESIWSGAAPPDAVALGRAAGGRMVYLSQASMHSALCSSALLAAAPEAAGAAGYAEHGWLRREAHHVVRSVARGAVGAAQRVAAQRAALRHAAGLGVAAVHECGGPGTSDEADFAAALGLSGVDDLPEVYGYWGELGAAAKARELGAVGAGGDLYADGALGAHTAWLSQAYADDEQGRTGFAYLDAGQVCAHVLGCVEQGVQAGFHAIGDAAIATVVDGFARAAARVGVERIRAGRHRVEHAELMTKRLIAGFVEYGLVACVQPAFDRLWGGPGRMYARRLGAARSLASNPFGAMHGVGVALAFGSDSPVTPVDPWGTVRAAMWHHNPGQRMSARAAFAAHTRGGWRAMHRDGDGVLVPGAPATFAVWDTPDGVSNGLPVLVAASEPGVRRAVADSVLPVCRRTVLRGRTIFLRE